MSIETLLRREAVMNRLGIRKSTFHVMLAAGELPKPIRVTRSVKAWPASEIDAFIERKKAIRDEARAEGASHG